MSFLHRRYHPPGTAPGTLVDIEGETRIPPQVSVTDYDADTLDESSDISVNEARRFLDSPRVTWVHCQGNADTNLLKKLGESFNLHPLAMEDVINGGQRSKVEVYDDRQIFVVINLPVLRDDELYIEQISLFLGPTFVMSFHAGPEDIFDPIRQRLRGPVGRFRTSGADYLLYALLDLIVDLSFPLLENFNDTLDELEEMVLRDPDTGTMEYIHNVKRELLLIRKSLWPQRDALNQLIRDEHPLVKDETKVYLRDVYDHGVRVLEMLEAFREMATGLLEVYLSGVSNRMNDIMRVLTIIATIFIPLSFLAGVYGMNFDTSSSLNMPELEWKYGYVAFWAIAIATAGGLLWYFRRKKWL